MLCVCTAVNLGTARKSLIPPRVDSLTVEIGVCVARNVLSAIRD